MEMYTLANRKPTIGTVQACLHRKTEMFMSGTGSMVKSVGLVNPRIFLEINTLGIGGGIKCLEFVNTTKQTGTSTLACFTKGNSIGMESTNGQEASIILAIGAKARKMGLGSMNTPMETVILGTF